jgi:hypothetical protein
MTSLAIHLHKRSVTTSMGAVAMLRRVADENGAAIPYGPRLEVTIPANDGRSARRIALDPGRWLIEATLPSGEVISEEIAVPKGKDVPVALHAADHSPHEWLGWQHLVGNIEGRAKLNELQDRARKAVREAADLLRNASEPRNVLERVRGVRELGGDLADILRAERAERPSVHFWVKPDGLRGADAWTRILEPVPASAIAWSPSNDDSEAGAWLYETGALAQPTQRQFAHVEWLGQRFVVSLPLPWRALADQAEVRAQLMVHRPPLKYEVQMGVIVEDPDFAPMAGLMTASTLPKAAVAVKQSYDMLFRKMLNPLGAAAGGYVLLAAGEGSGTDWHPWIDNLNDNFPSIPDGAILKASLRLRFPKNAASYVEARTALLEAFERGIPYYSAGVSWLLDGMTLLADDPDIEKRMRLVHRIALRLDLSQAFTCIRVSDKAKP